MQTYSFLYPIRFFYSHSSADSDLMLKFQNAIRKINDRYMKEYNIEKMYELYIAKRHYGGKPLINKLREEMLACNALILPWTRNTFLKKHNSIISFELGLAFSLKIPIFILVFSKHKKPWYFDKLTDYMDMETDNEEEIQETLLNMKFRELCNPIDVIFPKEEYSKENAKIASSNFDVINQDGCLELYRGFKGKLHYRIKNYRLRNEKNVRIKIKFCPRSTFSIDADFGDIDGKSGTLRLDFFKKIQGKNFFDIYWPAFPYSERIFEMNIEVSQTTTMTKAVMIIKVTCDNIIGWRIKEIPIYIKDRE